MLEWIPRGLRKGVVTTRYPRKPAVPPAGFRGQVEAIGEHDATPELAGVCPTRAIRVVDRRAEVDPRRCILCGACVAAHPGHFRFVSRFETAVRSAGDDTGEGGHSRLPLGSQSRTLKRSLHIRHVDAGSDGGEEWEIAALANPYYDMQRLGLYFTLSPRHADILLVSGGVTPSMELPLRRAYEAMPEPKAVVAAGTDACSGGLSALAGEVAGGVDRILPVDVYVPGSPPSPIALLHGLLLAAGILTEEAA